MVTLMGELVQAQVGGGGPKHFQDYDWGTQRRCVTVVARLCFFFFFPSPPRYCNHNTAPHPGIGTE
jgi:hypothetical protein